MIWKFLRRRRKQVATHTIDGQLTVVELPERANHPVKVDTDQPCIDAGSDSGAGCHDASSDGGGGCDGGD